MYDWGIVDCDIKFIYETNKQAKYLALPVDGFFLIQELTSNAFLCRVTW